jgi:hypothetical protein
MPLTCRARRRSSDRNCLRPPATRRAARPGPRRSAAGRAASGMPPPLLARMRMAGSILAPGPAQAAGTLSLRGTRPLQGRRPAGRARSHSLASAGGCHWDLGLGLVFPVTKPVAERRARHSNASAPPSPNSAVAIRMTVDRHQAMALGGPRRSAQGRVSPSRSSGSWSAQIGVFGQIPGNATGHRGKRARNSPMRFRWRRAPRRGAARARFHGFPWRRQALHRLCARLKPAPDWSVRRRIEYIEWARKVVDGLRGQMHRLKSNPMTPRAPRSNPSCPCYRIPLIVP